MKPHGGVAGVGALSALLGLSELLSANPAAACGGFFCSQQGAVNQAAEGVVFSDNGNGTITAVIEIQYQGPAERFSWLLPLGSVPEADDVKVSSNMAFARLRSATAPQYLLNRQVEGTCKSDGTEQGSAAGGTGSSAGGAGGTGGGRGELVSVEAAGVAGAFEWSVISVDASASDPAAPAAEWLAQNGYDVPPGSEALLGPYLADGMFLLALRLTKGADTGSIRPIEITYAASSPMIPLKLTAVAATPDMGVLTWVLSSARAVPYNYNALELNEARINWFNPSSNYAQVVTAAADEAGGQGFVTELAAPTSQLGSGKIWSAQDEDGWRRLPNRTTSQAAQFLSRLDSAYSGWSGLADAYRRTIPLPEGVTFEQFLACVTCYSDQLVFSSPDLVDAVDEEVIEPMRRAQALLDQAPYVTRLYTTLSAAEMTVDPAFVFNPALPDVAAVHAARFVLECNRDVYASEAPWRIELPQGTTIRGGGNTTTWPDALGAQPANARVLTLSSSGEGVVLADNRAVIGAAVADYNATAPRAGDSGGGCALRPASSRGAAPLPLALLGSALGGIALRRRRRSVGGAV
jgi:uncharacterized protein DUF2330